MPEGRSLWQSAVFRVCLFVVLFVLQNSLSVRSIFPLEKSLWTEKQRARTPEIPADISVTCYFD